MFIGRLPSNAVLNKKWIEVIGSENLNPLHSVVKICSLHFDASCFNNLIIVASDGVINIVKKAEKLIKPHLVNGKKPENYYLYIHKFLADYYDLENILCVADQSHNTNHRLALIKSIIKAYIDLRFRYHGKKFTGKVTFRNYLNKIVLFRNE